MISNYKKPISYSEYVAYSEECVLNKTSSGSYVDEDRVQYTKLNVSRMKRLDKTIKLTECEEQKFKDLPKQTWLVITETWCGDAAQTLPILNKIASINTNIDLQIVFRDENIELMNNFLTNGTQSIPKVIVFNESNEVVTTFGPRSNAATKLVQEYKEKFGKIDAKFKKDIQVWYNKDKGKSIIQDIFELLHPAKVKLQEVCS